MPRNPEYRRLKWRAWLGAALCVALAGCAVGPDYQRPEIDVGTAYKEAAPVPGWQPVRADAQAVPADWWRGFSDPQLDRLMDALPQGNLNIAEAEAQVRQAQAALASSRAGFFPSVDAGSSFNRTSQGRPSVKSDVYSLTGAVSWEPDLWGRVARSVQADEAGVQAGEADLAGVRLSMQSTLAQTYFTLRADDAQLRLLERTVEEYQRALTLTKNRYAAGVASPSDVAAASAQYQNSRTQMIRQGWQRAQEEHALAVLVGLTPAQLTLAPSEQITEVPEVPVGVPSVLLQRRPDIIAAERRAAAANAQIGVATAVWFPDLTLSAQGGFRAGEWAQWLTAPSRFWTLGPALALTIFDGGARQAGVDAARAAYDAQAAAYRQTVLTAMREVEDYLVQSQSLVREQQTQQLALDAARETLRQVTDQYQAGIVDYLSVVQAQTSAFSAEQSAISLQAEHLSATVQLIAALGGGWSAPTAEDGVVPAQ
ncbi:MAG: efflux transporter outer membrane subunit [Alcaligenaceae bacterium]|nr:efflux transporter outer membrane subunit [Alcaligenaceae bacterium]